MKAIYIRTIPHEEQRYETCGDWEFLFQDKSYLLQINVSDTGNEDSNFLVAIHELIEAYLCNKAGITGEQVDEWDMVHLNEDEPGHILGCPYRNQHIIAESIEFLLCSYLGASWKAHEENINKLNA